MNTLNRRIQALEARAASANAVRPTVLVDLISQPCSAGEAETRIAAARQQLGTHGLVVVVRVLVETPRAGLVTWLQSHEVLYKQAVAVLAVLALILICSL